MRMRLSLSNLDKARTADRAAKSKRMGDALVRRTRLMAGQGNLRFLGDWPTDAPAESQIVVTSIRYVVIWSEREGNLTRGLERFGTSLSRRVHRWRPTAEHSLRHHQANRDAGGDASTRGTAGRRLRSYVT
jgi:hypothetical protein